MNGPGTSSRRRGRVKTATLLSVAAALSAAALSGCGGSGPTAPSQNLGAVIPPGHRVPSTPLVDQNGRAVSLATYHGKYIVLAQFSTLCQDECPITTGAFEILKRSIDHAGLRTKVVFVEATMDPGRDTVARLHAYQTRFGTDWPLLTGTPSNVAALWRFFGIYYQRVPEDDPPATDWWTGKVLTYTIDHTNGFILIDPSGDERFISQDLPLLNGHLQSNLRSLLDSLGVQHLEHGLSGQGYTIPQALDALSWLLGRRIPLAPN